MPTVTLYLSIPRGRRTILTIYPRYYMVTSQIPLSISIINRRLTYHCSSRIQRRRHQNNINVLAKPFLLPSRQYIKPWNGKIGRSFEKQIYGTSTSLLIRRLQHLPKPPSRQRPLPSV